MTENPLTLDAEQVARLLTHDAARASQREAFLALHRGTGTSTPRAVLPIDDGYSFSYAARHAPDAGAVVKLGSFVPGNPARGLPAVSATVLVLDPVDGRLRATIDGTSLTTLRTAAASAVAVEALAPAGASSVAVLGSGVQGRAHVEAVREVLDVTSLRLWSPTRSTVEGWAREVAAEMPSAEVTVAATPAQAVAGADVVLCATVALDPLFDLDDLTDHALVVSVGSVAPDRHEVPGALVDTARVVVDSPGDARSTCGPVVAAIERGTLDGDALTGLGAVLDGDEPERRAGGRTLYLSLGIGLQDATAAWAVLDAAEGR